MRSIRSAIGSSVIASIALVAVPCSKADTVGVALKVGAVTWHAAKFVGKDVVLKGYVLAKEPRYILFSDEPNGKISIHDLPVGGEGVDTMQPTKRYVIEGVFLDGGFAAANGSVYHLELTAAPVEATP